MITSRSNKGLLSLSAALLCLAQGLKAEVDCSGLQARNSPEWLRSGTVYEIFPRAFSPAGNLKGVTAKLDELRDLGVSVLWTMPIHPIGARGRIGEFGSPYSIKDYYAVDPDYGTVADFKALVAGAHQRGMKVIMDLVADHTAWDSVMMTHPEYYKHDAQGRVIPPVPEWKDVVALNFQNAALREYMINMVKFWVQSCDVDGFRCDAASMVPADFWDQLRQELNKIKPDTVLLAEASEPGLLAKAFDLDYSWPLLSTVNNVLLRGAPASNIRQSWEDSRRRFPKCALHLRISDDHDEARAVARYGLNGALAASVLMFTLDGVPLLYNGMEVGDATESGGGALFDKLPLYWSPKDRPPLREIYHGLILLRKQYAALRNSRVDWMPNSDETSLLTFLRADNQDELLIVINFSNRPFEGKVQLKSVDGFVPLELSSAPGSTRSLLPMLCLTGFEWCIYHRSSR
ncbi:Alpha amylase catalytic region [Verrucomicrobia bacterium]|nr:Alpha amylase catalytic region [Verrucomicrobiota bacterium]